MSEELICITCPMGCRLKVDGRDDGTLSVTGNRCARGIKYAEEELLDPKRMVSATAKVSKPGAGLDAVSRVPVRTSVPCRKEAIGDLLADIYALTVDLPVARGQTLIQNWKGSGVDVLATRTLP